MQHRSIQVFTRGFLVSLLVLISTSCKQSTTTNSNEQLVTISALNVSGKNLNPIKSIPLDDASGYLYFNPAAFQNIPIKKDEWEFLLIPENNPQKLNFEKELSLDSIADGIFWGYAIRHYQTNRVLPLFGELKANGVDKYSGEKQSLLMQGYFHIAAFGRFDRETSTRKRLAFVGLTGFSGQRWVDGEQSSFDRHLMTHQAVDIGECEFVYDFWNSKRKGQGIEFENLSPIRIAHGRKVKLKNEDWTLYTNFPRNVNLELKDPTIQVLVNLLSTINTLPRVRYDKTFSYAEDHLDCKQTKLFEGRRVGSKLHDYSLYYPKIDQFRYFIKPSDSFRWGANRGVYDTVSKMYGNQPGPLSKFLALSRHEAQVSKRKPKTELNMMRLPSYPDDYLYAVGPSGQIEIWQVGGTGKNLGSIFDFGKNLKHRFPVSIEQIASLASQNYLTKCTDGMRLLIGDCNGESFPTVKLSQSGEQTEVWYSSDDRTLFAWNPSNNKLESSSLPPLSAGLAAQELQRGEFLCKQLEGNMAKIDGRLQKPFINKRPFDFWYNTSVPRLLNLIRKGELPELNSWWPKTEASRLENVERRGQNELWRLLSQAKRASKLANESICPETKALAESYVPMIENLYNETDKILDSLAKTVHREAAQLHRELYDAEKARLNAESRAYNQQFWANAINDFARTVDISQTVNQIQRQTNDLYRRGIEIQNAQRQQREARMAAQSSQRRAQELQQQAAQRSQSVSTSRLQPSTKPTATTNPTATTTSQPTNANVAQQTTKPATPWPTRFNVTFVVNIEKQNDLVFANKKLNTPLVPSQVIAKKITNFITSTGQCGQDGVVYAKLNSLVTAWWNNPTKPEVTRVEDIAKNNRYVAISATNALGDHAQVKSNVGNRYDSRSVYWQSSEQFARSLKGSGCAVVEFEGGFQQKIPIR